MTRPRLAAAVAASLLWLSATGCSLPAGSDSSASPTPTPSPEGPSVHAYTVKQIETLGGESISGTVCNITKPFTVTATTPKVTFAFLFVPRRPLGGSVSYSYSIPSAGESHTAAGTYVMTESKDGTLLVSLVVSDHVTFKGFDGNIPNRYKFDLVPSGTC